MNNKMDCVRQPEELKLTGNIEENWKAFKQRFELYMLAIGLEGDERRKIALLLTIAGRGALDVYNTFDFTEEERDKYDAVIAKFEQYCAPKKNETFERFVFRNRMQDEAESIEQYVSDLRLKSLSCNFGTQCESMIRDQLVNGVLDNNLRMHLLKEPDLTLDKAIKICQALENAKLQIRTFLNKNTAKVDTRREKPKINEQYGTHDNKEYGRYCYQQTPKQCSSFGGDSRYSWGERDSTKRCFVKEEVQLVEELSDNEDEKDSVYVITIKDEPSTSEDEWAAPMNVNGTDIPPNLKLSGAQCVQDLSSLTPQSLKQNLTPLRIANGEVVYGMLAGTSKPPVEFAPPQNFSSQKKKRNCQNNDQQPYVKKPPNAFILYMQEQRPYVLAEQPCNDNARVNTILGQKWRALSRREQSKYYEEADKLRKLHAEKYPWWSARENYGKMKRIRRKYPITSEEEYDQTV
ncbi:hypothetical protein JOB18_039750 [Solea senegalensis]|uniref:HMG box domain-containing protein n=1 Tax=Solea senegalensis TaxID=28829 RepID=A0AAV6Q439_SOLSE|nr:uncharacterized protein LOC122772847 [Solea senegalensis]KAG7483120.1 hypothetical protein JOB18_039750 [Solea senegalensis]